MEELHKPVLLSEVLAVLAPEAGQTYLDLTAGYAGHAERILDVTRNYKGSCLVDRDAFAIDFLRGKYESEPVEIMKADFYGAALQLLQRGNTFDMILADFGVSSPQLDEAERGFSLKHDGSLDMRMDREQDLTASDVVNGYSERELTEVFQRYGEVSSGLARKVAREIVHGRPYRGTVELAEAIVGSVYGKRSVNRINGMAKGSGDAVSGREAEYHNHYRGRKVHPATRFFQAIRMEVNDELGEIERTLPLLPKLLNSGGRVALISFHSLEDRLVKNYLKEATSYGEESELELITKSPIIAGNEELFINPRARSAKLRAARRL